MAIDDEVEKILKGIGLDERGVEVTLKLEPEFLGRESEVKQAIEAKLLALSKSARVELNGPRGLRVFT